MNFLVSFLEIYARLFAQKNTFVDEYKISANPLKCCIYNPPALPNQSRFQVPKSSFVQSIRFTSSTTNDRSVSAEEMESLLELLMTLIDKINEKCKEPSSKGSNASRCTKNERESLTDESKGSREPDDDFLKNNSNNESKPTDDDGTEKPLDNGIDDDDTGPTDEDGSEKPIDNEDDPKDNGNGEEKPNCDDRTGASLDIDIDDDDTGPENDDGTGKPIDDDKLKDRIKDGTGPEDDDRTGKPTDDDNPKDGDGRGKPFDDDNPKDGDGRGKPFDDDNPKDRFNEGTGPMDNDGSGEPIGDNKPKADGNNDGMVSLGTDEIMVDPAEYDSMGVGKPDVAVQNV